MSQPQQAYPVTRTSSEFLSLKMEADLLRRWHNDGDEMARKRLILAYRPLAVGMARRYSKGSALAMDDYIQEAMAGLIEAIDRFDITKHKTRISTLAHWHIKGRLRRHMFDYTGPCRVGTNINDKRALARYRQMRAIWETRNRREIDEAGRIEIAAELGIERSVLDRAEARLSSNDFAIDAPRNNSDDDSSTNANTLMACVENPENDIIEDHDYKRAISALMERLEDLSEREKTIVRRRLLAADTDQLSSLGSEFGVSKERIRQIERSAMGTLRAAIEKAGFTRRNLFSS